MKKIILISLLSIFMNNTFAQAIYTGKAIGLAKVHVKNTLIDVKNNSLEAKWLIINQVLYAQNFRNKETGQTINWKYTPWFYLKLKNGKQITSNEFKLISKPIVTSIKGRANAIKESDRFSGKSLTADLYCDKISLTIHWEVLLKDSSNYLINKFTLNVMDSLFIDTIGLIEIPQKYGLVSIGEVAGSPLSGNNFFFAIEHPMSHNCTNGQMVSSFMKQYQPIIKSKSLLFSTVWGVSPSKQMRRSFLYYLERERTEPYRQQLHYNTWYDIAWMTKKLNETSCLDRIQTFADSLIVKRNIHINTFLFDDGWDANETLWQFNSDFPNGFTKMNELAHKYHSNIGVWISPWGGYDEAKAQRLAYGKKQNPPFETNAKGFTLSGKNYYKRFFDVASGFVTKQGVNMFKFDGIAESDGTKEGNTNFEKDIEALCKLVTDLRAVNPELYFSLTVGTWPTPYWLFSGNAIWRGGLDTELAGQGTIRQQWLNFRDSEAYNNIVKNAPLFPLNSLMYHGICIADYGIPGKMEMDQKVISDEIWSFFGTGTGLQEIYINPHKLSSSNWDCLAKAIKWAKSNEDIMVDTHWVGGSPAKSEIYGFASWSPKKAILTLRNPSIKKKTFKVNVANIFELPNNSTKEYIFFDARAEKISQKVAQGSIFEITLEPFEVKVMDAIPIK